MRKRWIHCVLAGLMVSLAACGGPGVSDTTHSSGVVILPVNAFLAFNAHEEVRLPLLSVRMPGKSPTVTQCSLVTDTEQVLDCRLGPTPEAAGLAAWYVQVSNLAPGTYHFKNVRLNTAAGEQSFPLGTVLVEILPLKQATPQVRTGSYVTQSSRVEGYTVEVINESAAAMQIEGLHFQVDSLTPGRTLVSTSIDAQPNDYTLASGAVVVSPTERRNFRFEFAKPIDLTVAPPYYMVKPVLRFTSGGEQYRFALPLVSYVPSVPTQMLLQYLEKHPINPPDHA